MARAMTRGASRGAATTRAVTALPRGVARMTGE